MLLLALSCLQGRPMQRAFDELAALGAPLGAGVQLTPGNHPTPRFAEHAVRAPIRRHHGFDFAARRREVWSDDARCLVDAESVHPPRTGSRAADAIAARPCGLAAWLEARGPEAPVLETMYPGYLLGCGAELEEAMRLEVPLAVDVSHVFMQLEQGAMSDATWRRLAAYDRVREVQLSANDGRRDAHAPVGARSFGLAWARERLDAGVPVVLECYMHRLPIGDRRRQLDLVAGGGGAG